MAVKIYMVTRTLFLYSGELTVEDVQIYLRTREESQIYEHSVHVFSKNDENKENSRIVFTNSEEKEMTHMTGLEWLMENLKRLICCNNNPLINNNPFILEKRPKLQLLYHELESLRTFIIDVEVAEELCELREGGNLKKKLRDVVDETEDIVDVFVTSAFIRNNTSMTMCSSDGLGCSLDLNDLMKQIKSIKEELMDKKMQSETEGRHAAENFSTRSLSKLNSTSTVQEEVIVGLDDDAMAIVERLAGDQKQLDVISMVGMGGLGKTTLTTKVFNDPFVVYHFHVRAWVLVSQGYGKRDLLISLLKSIGKLAPEESSQLKDGKLSEILYKSLKGKRYLIAVDDVWSARAWDELKFLFPNDNNGSRILLTTRLAEVALYAKPGFTHFLRFLTTEESWELLCRKVFRRHECPERLIKPGKEIAKKCQGLPLSVVVVAGLLAKGKKSQHMWEKVAQSVSSYIAGDPRGYLDTLALSYDHLPRHLRDCFLYVGGFPENYKIPVRRLTWLWVAEGFIHDAGQRRLEEVATDYLMELIDRSLLLVAKRRSNGGVKACRIHDLLRELCLKKAREENFFQKMQRSDNLISSELILTTENRRRFFADSKVFTEISSNHSAPHIRTFLCLNKEWYFSLAVQRCFHPFLLLRVLDMQTIHTSIVPLAIELLVHLRYLALWSEVKKLASSICNLWNLQTLILRENYSGFMNLPDNMAKMLNLRHVWIEMIISIPDVKNPSNSDVFFSLQTISMLRLQGRAQSLLKRIPNIRKLGCAVYRDQTDFKFPNFSLLTHLQTLKVIQPEIAEVESLYSEKHIRFPATLKKLTLSGCRLPWSRMSNIQCLPNLEVLKLLNYAFEGPQWDTGDGQFCHLKFLKLQNLDIQQWDASRINFPCLKRLVVLECYYLQGIPQGLGDIATLEMIDIDKRNHSVVNSTSRIREEQQGMGNYDLKINVVRFLTSVS